MLKCRIKIQFAYVTTTWHIFTYSVIFDSIEHFLLIVSILQVNKIREQCQKQEDTMKEQEGELDSRRSELQKLKDEETSLEKEYDTNLKELQSLSTKLQDTQLQISQVNLFFHDYEIMNLFTYDICVFSR